MQPIATTAQDHPIAIRPATAADIPSIHAIYTPYVTTSIATFELTPPTPAALLSRLHATHAARLPYLVATSPSLSRSSADATVIGYAYASPYRARAAYRFTAETTVYVAASQRGRGAGRALMGAVLEALAAGGTRQAVAVVAVERGAEAAAGSASAAFHAALGFRRVGVLEGVGWKGGRWVDTLVMQREVGQGCGAGVPADGEEGEEGEGKAEEGHDASVNACGGSSYSTVAPG